MQDEKLLMVMKSMQKNLTWTPQRQRLQRATNKNTRYNRLVDYTWTSKLVGHKGNLQSVMKVGLQNPTNQIRQSEKNY